MNGRAWVVTIGDELLRGEIVDSNKSFLSDRLLRLDVETDRHMTVADDPDAIEEALRAAAERADVVLVSGGLGPTRDDITTELAARTFGRELVRDPDVIERLESYYRSVGRQMAENNRKQADFPAGAEILPNPVGTAPGFMLEVEEGGGALLFFMPGVPRELYRMVDEQVLPRIESRLDRGDAVRASLLRTFGMGESALDEELGDLAREDPAVTLGFRVQFPDNLVRVLVRAPTEAEADARLAKELELIRARLGSIVIGDADRRLEEVTGALLLESGRTLSVAESCTGGLIASRLTDVPGSSGYLLEAAVTYSYDAKQRRLGVSAADLEQHGAVSEPVVRQMAEGIRAASGSDLAIATSGILGPGGATEDKPVGTLWIALADADGTVARRYQLMRERGRNKELATHIALDWIRRRLLGLELPGETFPRLRGTPPAGEGSR